MRAASVIAMTNDFLLLMPPSIAIMLLPGGEREC